jgi:hypothetical protein
VSGVTQPFAGIPDELDVTGAKTPLTYCYYMTFSVEQNSLDFCTMPNGRFGSISAVRPWHERQSIIDHLGPLANS